MVPKILVVDDEEVMRDSLRDGLYYFNSEFNVTTAGNGREAISIIEGGGVDLLVTDLRMPEMNGFELISWVSRNAPFLPVIAMTAFGSPYTEINLRKGGNFQYIEKPVNLENLVERILNGLAGGSGGTFGAVFLPAFLQLVELERLTCTLTILTDGRSGSLSFSTGKLADAEAADRRGVAAAEEIVGWSDVRIAIHLVENAAPQRIDKTLSEILQKSPVLNGKGPVPRKGPGPAGKRTKSAAEEANMNSKKLYDAIKQLQEDMGEGLLATDVWGANDAVSLAGVNSQPKAVALFNKITVMLNRTLGGSGFPELGEYYLLKLVDNKMIIVLPLGDYQWGMLIDSSRTQLGMALSVAIPNLITSFKQAMASN